MSATMLPRDVGQPLVIRLAPWCRRVAIYLIAGYALLVAVSIGLKWTDLSPHEWWEVVVFQCAIPAIFCTVLPTMLFRYRLRLDTAGIWRRRFFRWDLWPWGAFAEGTVRHGTSSDSYEILGKPWWHRYLHLEFFAPADRNVLADRISQVWRPPPLVLPERLTLTHSIGERLTVSPEGVRASFWRRAGRSYPWSAVERVSVSRLNHDRRDFRRLEIAVAGREKPIRVPRCRDQAVTWSVAEGEVLVGLFQRYVPAERIEYIAQSGPPVTITEADHRLVELEQIERRDRRSALIAVLFLAALFVVEFCVVLPLIGYHDIWSDKFVIVAVVVGLIGIPTILNLFAMANRARFRRQRDELLRWRRALLK